MVVKEAFKKLGLHFIFIHLGEVEIMESLSEPMLEYLKVKLLDAGFEALDDKKAVLNEIIKNEIVEMVYNSDNTIKFNFPLK